MNIEPQVAEVFLEDIIPNRFQPRLSFDETKINELASSIKVHGVIQPLVLRKLGDKYEIIAGERRFKAAGIAGLTKVPAIITNLDDNQSAEIALVENLQRKDLSAIEEAKSYKKLLDRGYLSQEQLAAKMGISQSSIANKLRLLNLDEDIQKALLEEKISERHARSLLAVPDFNKQKEFKERIERERLTVKQLDQEIQKWKERGPESMELFTTEEDGKIEKLDTIIFNEPVTPLNNSNDLLNNISETNEFNPSPDLSQVPEPMFIDAPVVENVVPTSENHQETLNTDDNMFQEQNSVVNSSNQFEPAQMIETPPNDQTFLATPTIEEVISTPSESINLDEQKQITSDNSEKIINTDNSFFNFFNQSNKIEEQKSEESSSLSIPSLEELSILPVNNEPIKEESSPSDDFLNSYNQLSSVNLNPTPLYESQEPESPKIEEIKIRIDKENFKSVEKAFEDLKKEIESAGLKIDMDTYNFEQYYQLIIKVYK